jgi:2'-hydroxyisoflavone reductase
MSSRRKFIQSSTAAGIAAMAGMMSLPITAGPSVGRSKKPLKILFLGGTGFLGPHTVNHAISRGHEVTLFNRGRSSEGLFPELISIIGNRDPKVDKGLSELKGKHWDCVIDTSGYVPRIVDASSALLADFCDQYLFVSSISVYSDFAKISLNESSAVGTLDDTTVETIDGETYGPLKAYCEQAVEKNFKDRATIIRPGLIVGPRDRTDRYTYWPVRVAKGGEVLCPGDGKDFVQYIDVRDLGAFMIDCLEQRAVGIFNATSPMNDETTLEMLNHCKKSANSDALLTWADANFLETLDVQAWGDMPVWVSRQSDLVGLAQIDVTKAQQQGLSFRSRDLTVKDTLNWFGKQNANRRKNLRAGITSEREAEVLKLWHNSKKQS